jgi:hypothetical protein
LAAGLSSRSLSEGHGTGGHILKSIAAKAIARST